VSRWFRLYSDAMRHPKVARLTDKEFRLWVELLAVAADNDGVIHALDELRYTLKRRLDHLSTGVERLISVGLITPLADGYEPHNWKKRQYKSDVSTYRVQKHRAKGNVSETPPDTETDTETEAEKNITPNGVCASAVADTPDLLIFGFGDMRLAALAVMAAWFQWAEAEIDAGRLKPEHVVAEWNQVAARLGKPKVRDLTPERRQLLKARIAQYDLDDFLSVFGKIERSPFLRGDTGWNRCNFDWIFKKANFQKALEGNYDQ
jgi:hypothetical protein